MSSVYRIALRGPVPDRFLVPYIDEFTIERTDVATILTGAITDGSQLHGLVAHLSALGIDIVELHEQSGDSTPDRAGDERPRRPPANNDR